MLGAVVAVYPPQHADGGDGDDIQKENRHADPPLDEVEPQPFQPRRRKTRQPRQKLGNEHKNEDGEQDAWYVITAKMEYKFNRAYGRRGPVLTAVSAEPCEAPDPSVATFY